MGSIEGAVGVSREGAATYEFAIEVPPGRAGMEPRISVAYTSQDVESVLGVGFALNASSAISRCPRNVAQDGERRGIEFSEDDRLCLDGARLVPDRAGARYGAPDTRYRTELDSLRRVRRGSWTASGVEGAPGYVVEMPDGRTRRYGDRADGRVVLQLDERRVAESWLLTEERDPQGNLISYYYEQVEAPLPEAYAGLPVRPIVRLLAIAYTGVVGGADGDRFVIFQYQTEPRVLDAGNLLQGRFGAGAPSALGTLTAFDHGSVTWPVSTYPLRAITTFAGGDAVNRWYFRGDDDNSARRWRLNEAQRCTFAPAVSEEDLDPVERLVCMPATRFRWRDREVVPNAFSVGGDALDSRYGEATFQRYDVDLRRAARLGLSYCPPDDRLCSEADPIVALDFNGDGADDILYLRNTPAGVRAAIAPGRVTTRPGDLASFRSVDEVPFARAAARDAFFPTIRTVGGGVGGPSILTDVRSYTPIDWNLDGRDDLIMPFLTGLRALVSTDGGFQITATDFELPAGGTGHMWPPVVADLNGDGRQDVLVCERTRRVVNYARDPRFRGFVGRWIFATRETDGTFSTPRIVAGATNCAFEYGEDTVSRAESDYETNVLAFQPSRGDFDGDGREEVLIAPGFTDVDWSGGNRILRWDSAANQVVMADSGVAATDPVGGAGRRYVVADLNGDGLHDLFLPHSVVGPEPTTREELDHARSYVAFSTGRGFTDFMPLEPVPHGRMRNSSREYIDEPLASARSVLATLPFDLNGDHRGDLLLATHATTSSFPSSPGDGRYRVWGPESYFAADIFSPDDWVWYPTTLETRDTITGTVGSPTNPGRAPLGVTFVRSELTVLDADGDGALDILETLARDSRRPNVPSERLYHNVRAEAPLLVEVTDGFGAVTRIDYATRAQPSVYTPGTGCEYPQRCLTDSAWVVRDVEEDDGLGGFHRREYSYVDGRTDLTGRGFVGYARIIERDVTSGVTTERHFDNTGTRPIETDPRKVYFAAALPVLTRVYRTAGVTTPASVRFEGVRVEATIETEADAAIPGLYRLRVPRVAEAYFEEMAPPAPGADPFAGFSPVYSSTTTRTGYDGFGFASRVRTVTSDESSDVVTDYEHSTGASWRIGFARERRTTVGLIGLDRSCDRRVVVRWDNDLTAARPRAMTRNPDDPATRRETLFTYGAFGNVEAVRTFTESDGVRSVEVDWDADGYFPIATRNALGHESRIAYEPWFGGVRAAVDPNAVESRSWVDGFGRPRRDEDDTGAVSEIYYQRTRSDGRTRIESASLTEGHQAIEIDRLGRTVQLEEFHALVHSVVDLTYDRRGRLRARTEPHPAGTAIGPVTTWTYDGLDRVRTIRSAEVEEFSRYRYEPRTTVRIDARGNETRTTADARGNVASVSEPAGGGTTSYSYCAAGELRAVRDAAGNTTRVTYDRLGRRIRLEDPDSGSQFFGYDAWDEVTSTQDAEGRISRFERDVLGRLTDRFDDRDGDHFHWDFDTARAPSGRLLLGVLERASSGDGVSDVAEYDDLARPVAVRRSIDSITLVATASYDEFGRVASTTSPSANPATALTVHYEYDDEGGSGELVAIDGTVPYLSRDRAPLWRLVEQDPHGGPTRELLGNGAPSAPGVAHWADGALERETGYTVTGRTNRILSRRADFHQVWQSLTYEYDDRGLLEARHRYTGGALTELEDETYEYDAIGRLRFLRREGSLAESYGYDSIGNIEETHDATLVYGEPGAGPHAVSTYAGDRGEVYPVSYTASGNAEVIGDQRIEYNQFNLPTTVTGLPGGGGGTASFEYDASGERARKTSSSGTTIYFAGYELELSGATFFERTPIAGPTGIIAQLETGFAANQSFVRLRWLLPDAQGSIETSGLSGGTPTHHAFDAFGGVRAADGSVSAGEPSPDVNHGYTGHEHEADVGLINMGGRVYQPILRRFLSPDPVSSGAGQDLNRYSYALNSPHNVVDPSGMQEVGLGDGGISVPLDGGTRTDRFEDEGFDDTEEDLDGVVELDEGDAPTRPSGDATGDVSASRRTAVPEGVSVGSGGDAGSGGHSDDWVGEWIGNDPVVGALLGSAVGVAASYAAPYVAYAAGWGVGALAAAGPVGWTVLAVGALGAGWFAGSVITDTAESAGRVVSGTGTATDYFNVASGIGGLWTGGSGATASAGRFGAGLADGAAALTTLRGWMGAGGAEETVSVFHGSIKNGARILASGLDPARGPTFVSRDLAAALDALTNHPDAVPGLGMIIESRIPASQFQSVLAPLERPYGGFYPYRLQSTEITLRSPLHFELFNKFMVRP